MVKSDYGKTIRGTNRTFLVTGVLMAKGQSLTGRNKDDQCFHTKLLPVKGELPAINFTFGAVIC
ncbi:MAG: hypothetical protein IPP22_09480 [Nitrosomonas sp.]|nr:hypothetical protein [Nitrosomonas sp.]